MVRDEYKRHVKKQSLSKEEKTTLNNIVYKLIDTVVSDEVCIFMHIEKGEAAVV